MITKIEEIMITQENYPFASAEKYCALSKHGYIEKEYYMYGTANVYETINENGEVAVKYENAPYVNRFIVRAPKMPQNCSGNVVIEIINPTSFMEIDRMWILGHKEFIRNGDIYIGITSKPNTIPKLQEFNQERYQKLQWSNPLKHIPFPFHVEDVIKESGLLPDLDIHYEPGLFWDMLSDLAWLVRRQDEQNPIHQYPHQYIYLTGWSQSAGYLLRYVNSFAYRPEVKKDGCVFDGYLAGGTVKSLCVPVNQYESDHDWNLQLCRIKKSYQPYISVQTESENGQFNGYLTMQNDCDDKDFKYRLYEVTGASHDSVYSYYDYYQNDEDLRRINKLPQYYGKHAYANDYPSQILFQAAFRNLFLWVRKGIAPKSCARIQQTIYGENKKDVFGNTIGGLRTCLLDYPTGRFFSASHIEKGQNPIYPESDIDPLIGYQEGFSSTTLKELYGSLGHYEELIRQHTDEQIAQGFICKEDKEELIEIALQLAKKRGLL